MPMMRPRRLFQIADNIAHVGIRDNDLERAYRLKQYRICLRDTGPCRPDGPPS